MEITVLDADSWGTALALRFPQHGNEVALWSRNTAYVKKLQADRESKEELPGFTFPDTLYVHTDLGEALEGPELAIIATFVVGLRDSVTLPKQNDAAHLPVPAARKGFEQDIGLLALQIVENTLPGNRKIGVLSGPSFAQELAQQLPCVVVPASENKEWIEELILQLNTGVMRLYGSNDAVGVAAGDTVKNIMVIAIGLSDDLECGLNARAALVTRDLAEIIRLAVAMGTQSKTLMEFAGIGGLVLTCTSVFSRSRCVDLGLAESKELHQILMEIGHVSEGVSTIEEVLNTAVRYRIDIPITQTLFQFIRKEMIPQQVVERLMERNACFE